MDERSGLPLTALRRLAHGLLYGRDGAEDVVQEAWLAALRKRPPPAELAGWLRASIRDRVRDLLRRNARRAERERRAARDEALPSTLELGARLELLHALLDAVGRLDEPYRTAIGLRFFDDLPPRTIAKRLGLPVNTVRTHVRRGLAELRRELDVRPGREGFLAVLAPLAGKVPWSAGLASASVGGGLVMLAGKKLLVSGAIVLLLGAAWIALRPSPSVPAEPALAKAPAEVAVVPLERQPAAPDVPAAQAERVPSPSADRPAPARCELVVRTRTSALPLPGARVQVERLDETPRTFTTDEHGALELEPALLRAARVEVWADGHFPRALRFDDPSTAAPNVIELELAGELRVTVLEEDGRPVPRAFVMVDPEARETLEIWPDLCYLREQLGTLPFSQLSVTDARGEVVLAPFPCDRALIVSAREVVPATSVRTLIPSATRTQSLAIRVTRHGCIRGRLVWEDGAPAIDRPGSPFVRSLLGDEVELNRAVGIRPDGSFELCGLPLGWVRWCAQHNGGPLDRYFERVDHLESATLDVGTIRLARPGLVEGRVFLTGSDGALPELATQYVRDGEVVGGGLTSADGRIWDVVPPGAVTFGLYSPGGARLLERRLEVPCEPLSIALDTCVAALELERPPVDRTSTFALVLSEARAGGRVLRYAQNPRGAPATALRWGADRLSVSLVPPGAYDVYVIDARPRLLGRASLAPGRTTRLECAEIEPARLAGELRSAQGPLAGAGVAAMLEAGGERARLTCTSDADGRFTLDGLAPGRWLVYPDSLGPASHAAVALELAPGERGSVALVAEKPGSISGGVLRAGDGLAGASVRLLPGGAHTTSDGDGLYTFEGVYPGRYSVYASSRGPDGEFQWRTSAVEVAAGESASLDLELAAPGRIVTVRRRDAPFPALSGAHAVGASGVTGSRRVPGRDDALELALDPGPCLLLVYSEAAPWVMGSPWPELVHAAYLPQVPAAREIEVEIDGATLVVDASGSAELLPLAYLMRVGPLEPPDSGDGAPALVFEDFEHGKRRFLDLPLGARVRLAPRDPAADSPSLDVTIERLGELVVRWPPP